MQRGGLNPRGYTILEVMIFLAISGVMFVIAAGFISGKQGRTEFRQSMNAINAQIQQTINDVANGFYPSANNLTCTADNLGNPPNITSTANTQGKNQGCVFLGKVIQFGVQGTGMRGYNVYSITGRQYVGSATQGKVPTTFTEAKPEVIYNPVDLTEYKKLEHGAMVTKMRSSGADVNAIGFFNSFGSYDGGGTLQSGSQTVSAVIIPGTSSALNESTPNMVAEINTFMSVAYTTPNPDITVCFDSGRGQYATLTIGGSAGQRLTSSVQIDNVVSAACT